LSSIQTNDVSARRSFGRSVIGTPDQKKKEIPEWFLTRGREFGKMANPFVVRKVRTRMYNVKNRYFRISSTQLDKDDGRYVRASGAGEWGRGESAADYSRKNNSYNRVKFGDLSITGPWLVQTAATMNCSNQAFGSQCCRGRSL
jgi:hypothetical protein